MWIALGIVGGLVLIITVILMLPVYVIVKNDENNELMIRYKFLHWVFGEEPDPENPILVFAKEVTGLSKTDKEAIKSNVKQSGVVVTVQDTCRILVSLLEQVVWIIKYCTLVKLYVTAVCVGDEAGDAALNYGKCCAAVYPTVGVINRIFKVKMRHQRIDVRCDFQAEEGRFLYDVKLRVSVLRVLQAFINIVIKEAMRVSKKQMAAEEGLPPAYRKKLRKKKRTVNTAR